MEVRKQYYENRGNILVKKLKQRNMDAGYYQSSAEAVTAVLKTIPPGASVSWGGSVSMDECGLTAALKSGDYNVIDRADAKNSEEVSDVYHKALNCDYFIMSTNAVTLDGQLVNIDGNGNRLAALIYGPEHVIVVAGMNKVAKNLEEALSRVSSTAAPMNANRLERNTPCAKNGSCSDCQSDDCICCQTVITRRSRIKDRIKVFLIGEELGF